MGSASRPSDADHDLSDRLAARGVRANSSWLRHLRSEHEIPGPVLVRELPRHGRRGGLYRYTAEAEDYAAEKLRLLALRRDLAAVNLAMFGGGVNPDERALKHAYLKVVERWRWLLLQERGLGMSVLDIVETVIDTRLHKILGSAFAREMVDRVRRRTRARLPVEVRRRRQMPAEDPEPPRGPVATAITQALAIGLSGAPSSNEALDDFIEASGIGAMSEDQWEGRGPISRGHPRATVRLVLKHATFSRLDRHVQSASMAELVEARDAAALFVSLLVDARKVIRFLTPLPDAFGFGLLTPGLIQRVAGALGIDLIIGLCVPMILVISDLFPTQYRESLALFSYNAPTYRALVSCIESLPAELRGLDGGRRLRRLPQDEQRRLIMDWAKDHVEEAAILGIDWQDDPHNRVPREAVS